MLGECVVYDYLCKYHFDPPFLYLIPNNLDQAGELYRKLYAEIRSSKLITLTSRKSFQQNSGFYFFPQMLFYQRIVMEYDLMLYISLSVIQIVK